MKKVGAITLKIVLSFAVLGIIFIILVSAGVFGRLQTQSNLLNFRNAEATTVLSEEGEVIGRFFYENRTKEVILALPLVALTLRKVQASPVLLEKIVPRRDADMTRRKRRAFFERLFKR
ncbi:MAG: hypothetical protein ACOXZV_02835 [Bacteroidales bacterium]